MAQAQNTAVHGHDHGAVAGFGQRGQRGGQQRKGQPLRHAARTDRDRQRPDGGEAAGKEQNEALPDHITPRGRQHERVPGKAPVEPAKVAGHACRAQRGQSEHQTDPRGRRLVKLVGQKRKIGDGRAVQHAEAKKREAENADGLRAKNDAPALGGVALPVGTRGRAVQGNAKGKPGHGQGQQGEPERQSPGKFPQRAADERIQCRGDADCRAHKAHHARALLLGAAVPRQRAVQDAERRGPQPLHRPAQEQGLKIVRKGAPDAARGKERKPGQQNGLAPEAIGQNPGGGRRKRARQGEGGDKPPRPRPDQVKMIRHARQNRQNDRNAHHPHEGKGKNEQDVGSTGHGRLRIQRCSEPSSGAWEKARGEGRSFLPRRFRPAAAHTRVIVAMYSSWLSR